MSRSRGVIQQTRWKVVINATSNYVGRFLTLGMWFFLTPFILNRVGSSAYGAWTLVTSLLAYGTLLGLGIAKAITKYVAEFRGKGEPEQAQRLVATALWLYIGLGVLAFAAAAGFAPFFPDLFNVPEAERSAAIWLVVLTGAQLAITLLSATTIAVLEGLQRYDLINILSITGSLVIGAGIVAVLLLGGGVVGIAAVQVPLTLVMIVPAVIFIRRTAPDFRFSLSGASRKLARTVASFSTALFIINVAKQLQWKTDEIVIGANMPIQSVTPYAIAHRLSSYSMSLTVQFVKVIMPLASQLHAERKTEQLQELFTTSLRISIAIFLTIGIGTVVLAAPFLSAWVGPEYARYDYLVTLLTYASFLEIIRRVLAFLLQGVSQHRFMAVTSLVSGLANLALSIILVRPYGLTGIALGTIIPSTIEIVFFVLPYALRVFRLGAGHALYAIFIPAFLPAVPLALALYALKAWLQPASLISILFVAVCGLGVYGVGYFLMKQNARERQMGKELWALMALEKDLGSGGS